MKEKEMQEPTCNSCGSTGWKPSTRREFIHGTVVAGIGLVVGTSMLAAPLSAAAEISYYSCDLQYDSCMYSAAQESNPVKRTLMEIVCAAEKADCYARTALEQVGDAIVEAGQWIVDHAGAIIVGTVVVILVIAFIVVTNGAGAPVLAFL